MSKRARIFTTIFAICSLIFIALTVVCIKAWSDDGTLLRRGTKTQAKVINYVPGRISKVASTPGKVTVSYVQSSGASAVATTEDNDVQYRPGDSIEIIYDPQAPERVLLPGQNQQSVDLTYGVMVGVAAIFSVVALIVMVAKNPK